MVGSRNNSVREAGCLNCKPRKGPTQMSSTCRYSQPCRKDIQSYCKSSLSNTEADKDRIWKIALEIWNTMTSSMVARAFLLAYRIMGKIVETKGDTDWLKNGAPHCNVRKDYADTERGVKKIEDIIGVDDDEPESSQCY